MSATARKIERLEDERNNLQASYNDLFMENERLKAQLERMTLGYRDLEEEVRRLQAALCTLSLVASN